jgi:soluble lytic murein transglycosylase-like protein
VSGVDVQRLRAMRLRTVFPLAATILLAAPAVASANFLHVVSPGESLSSVAATDGLSVGQLAAANGISPASPLISGSTLAIPPQGAAGGTGPVAAGTSRAASTVGDGDGDSDDPGGTVTAAASPHVAAAAPVQSSTGSGAYVVRPGDTLSAIAARAGMTIAQLAAANGLNPNGYLISGSVLRFGGGAAGPTAAAVSQPVGAPAQGSPAGPPFPTAQRVTSSQVGSIAAANGVPPSLAQAIGWQESGFNNGLTSSADARGVMQILPGTWQWINSSLTRTPLSPASATDNVRGGVLMLHSLLQATGGNPSLAAAGYYQGLPSVERHGLFPSTQRYVRDVMSLASSFGGG